MLYLQVASTKDYHHLSSFGVGVVCMRIPCISAISLFNVSVTRRCCFTVDSPINSLASTLTCKENKTHTVVCLSPFLVEKMSHIQCCGDYSKLIRLPIVVEW